MSLVPILNKPFRLKAFSIVMTNTLNAAGYKTCDPT